MPKVSIIIPIYNTAPFLEKCLSSVANQTLTDIEIICVNDGSTDDSQTIIQHFIDTYPFRFKAISKPNGGLSDARNVGLQFATGEYIAFLDSDDFVEPTLYEQLYQMAQTTQSDIVTCGFQRETLDGKVLSIEQCQLKSVYHPIDSMLAIAPAAWNKLYHRRLWVETQLTYPKGLWYEDLPTTLKLLLHANQIATIPQSLIHYIQHPHSISYTFDQRAYDIFTVLEDVREYVSTLQTREPSRYDESEWHQIWQHIEAITLIHLVFAHLFRVASLKKGPIQADIQQVYQYLQTHFPKWSQNRAIYRELSWVKKGCVAIGLLAFRCHLFYPLLCLYRFINHLKPIQGKW